MAAESLPKCLSTDGSQRWAALEAEHSVGQGHVRSSGRRFASAYADLTAKDHARLVEAIDENE
jgi:hypothetical protein